jgi:hypothetical protein
VSGDGRVGFWDVLELSSAVARGSSDGRYDVNGDGTVNALDLFAVMSARH